MIDYVKGRTHQPGLPQRLQSDSRLEFIDHYNKLGQKVGVKATYCGLTWYVFGSGLVEVAGSLHKCWNSLNGRDAINWNDFRRLDLFDTLDWLAREFGLVLTSATLHNVEFGVNLHLPPAPPTVRDLLSRLLFYGKGQPFVEQPVDRGYYKRMDSSDFYIKAYDKGTQYNTPDQRLRFEKGVNRMKELNTPGHPALLITLADLTDTARLDQLGKLLLIAYDRCFWADVVGIAGLTAHDQKTVDQAHNVTTWSALTSIQRHRLRNDYERIANRNDYRLSSHLREQITAKWLDLLEVDCNVLRRGGMKGFTGLENRIKPYITTTSVERETPVEEVAVKPVDQPTRQCPVTGYDISHQRANTRFVSTATVRVWYDLDRDKFDALAKQYLTNKQAGADLDKRCYHIAHNIRNTSTNPRNNPIRSLKKLLTVAKGQTLPLFPAAGVVRPTDRQLLTIEYRKGTPWEICL